MCTNILLAVNEIGLIKMIRCFWKKFIDKMQKMISIMKLIEYL